MTKQAADSYRDIFKSQAILGSARVITILIGMLRVKLMAIFLGPIGTGLLGTYESIVIMVSTITGMGMTRSGARVVARAKGSGDRENISQATKTIRLVVWLLGISGTLMMAFLAWPISYLTFKSSAHVLQIILLSATVLMITQTGGLSAILQGLGRIVDLAKQSTLGTAAGTFATLALLVTLKEKAIVPIIIAVYAGPFAVAWWLVKRVNLPQVRMAWIESIRETGPLLKLGFALMNVSFLSSLVAYTSRTLIVHDLGMEAVGIYLCAFSLSGKFIGFIIDAMWMDFLPRASAVADDHIALHKVVNEQTEIALLLAMPGLLATIFFAPWLIRFFYTHAFGEATLLIRWFSLGCLVAVINGPLRVIMIAKGKSLLCFLSEMFTSLLHVTMIFVLLKLLSLPGSAIAYTVNYIAQTLLYLLFANRLTGFKWSSNTIKLLLIFFPIVVCVFLASLILTKWQTTILGSVGTIVCSLYCLQGLIQRLGHDHCLSQFAAKTPIIGHLLVRK